MVFPLSYRRPNPTISLIRDRGGVGLRRVRRGRHGRRRGLSRVRRIRDVRSSCSSFGGRAEGEEDENVEVTNNF